MEARSAAPRHAPVRQHRGRAMRRVGEKLASRYTEIGQAVAERIVDEIPGYGSVAPEVIADLRAGATATVELLARTFTDGSSVRREDLGFLRGLAARRVHQGVSLEDFIHAYRVALLAYWDACVEEAMRLKLPRQAGFELASSDRGDRHHHHPGRRGVSARRDADQNPKWSRGQRPARAPDPRRADRPPGRRHPAAPGLDPTGQLLTIVGTVQRTTLAVADALQLARDTLEEDMSLGAARPLAAIRHGELVLVTSGTAPHDKFASLRAARQRTIEQQNVDVHYGVSVPSHGFASVPQAYREAALSLSYTSPSRPILSLHDLSSLECALIGATAATKAVIASKGNSLQALSDEDLAVSIETIRAFADADLNVAGAAQRIQVHPNTVRYRLGQIATKTGHDPRTFAGLVELRCILEITQTGRR